MAINPTMFNSSPLTQEELEAQRYQEFLGQAFSTPQAQALSSGPQISAQENADIDAQIAAQAPVMQGLQAEQQAIRDARAAQLAAMTNVSEAQNQTPGARFATEGQTLGQAFRDPNKNQRAAMRDFGLSLLSSSGSTQNLSSRLGMALGSGAQALQAGRQAGIEQETKAQQLALQQANFGAQAASQDLQFGQQARTAEAAQAKLVADIQAAKTKEEREAVLFEFQQNDEERKIEAASIKAAEDLAKKGRIDQMGDLQIDGLPVFENYQGDLIFATGEPLSPDQRLRVAEPIKQGISIGPGGQLIAGSLSKEISKSDQAYFKRSQEAAVNSDKQLRSLNIMEDALAQGLKTGIGTGIERGFGQAVGSIESALGIDVPVGESAEQQNTLGRMFDVESRSLGVQGLQAFGGSDTERELLVSLSIQPSLSYTPDTNRRILSNKRAAVELLMQEEDFANKWLSENGSLQNKNKDGDYFRKSWMDFQRQNYKAMDYTGLPKDILEQARMTADSYSGTSSKFDSAGRARSDFGTDNSTVQQALRLITQ
jgi:hypothetical protein